MKAAMALSDQSNNNHVYHICVIRVNKSYSIELNRENTTKNVLDVISGYFQFDLPPDSRPSEMTLKLLIVLHVFFSFFSTRGVLKRDRQNGLLNWIELWKHCKECFGCYIRIFPVWPPSRFSAFCDDFKTFDSPLCFSFFSARGVLIRDRGIRIAHIMYIKYPFSHGLL